MKGPFETMPDAADAQPEQGGVQSKAAAYKKKLTPPPGGKALERLLLFTEERGLPTPKEVAAADEESGEKTTEKSKKSKAIKTGAEDPGNEDGGITQQYAQALMDASVKLETESTESTEGDNFSERGIEPATGAVPPTSPPTGIGPQWRYIGPNGMPNGQTYGDTRVMVSGRVAALVIDPSNPNHLLCGSASGGVWESFNRGVNWFPRTDYMPTLTTGALAFTPSAPNIVYCGTGEGNFYGGQGAGILRSTNGGTTWALLTASPFVGRGFYDLIVDRANGNHLLAATTGGIYESSNGGTVWALRLAVRCWDLAMHPAGGPASEVLAACSDGLYRSTNGGTTYTRVTLPGSPASFDRLAVDISRSNPAFAYAFGASGAVSYLYQRNAAGAWVSITKPGGLSTSQAWYDWFLAVSPDNHLQIYLGAIEAYRGTFAGGVWTWVTISNKAGDDIHPDQHCIAIELTNANNIYIGCDGGVFGSTNRGINWTSLNNTLGITEIEYMAQDLGSIRWLMAGTQDNGTCRYTGNINWDHIADGDGGDCGVNRANPNIVYHTYYSMGMERSVTRGNFGSFSWIFPAVPAGYSNLFYPPVEVNNDTVAMAGSTVYISRNQGTAWSNIALPASCVASSMYIPNPNTVLVGCTNGRIFRITWSGAAWSAAVALTTPRIGAWISDIFVDAVNLNRIWATSTSLGGGRVFRSDNAGVTWVDLSAGLPNLPISSVQVDPGNANRVWVAADVGVYQSFNAGATWAAFANGLPNALAVDLLYHHHARVLRVALRNRGVWEIPVDGVLTAPICGVQWNGTLNPNQTQTWFTFNWPATWHMLWTVMPVTPVPGAKITCKVAVERGGAEYATYWITVTNLTNQTVNFQGRYAILSFY
ncbi:MAG: hypothetical protein H7Z13_00130 [Ferruginibacter sp.]|nr:hypothetical protein [Ferruginibacter sp.]